MADRPILFSAPMIRALMDGRKTQTRRICAWANNPNSPQLTYIVPCDEPGWFGDEEGEVQFHAGYATGDRLWVKETWLCTRCIADESDESERDDDQFAGGPAFECAGYNDGSGFYCPLWGSEECDWECPKGGME